MNPHKAWVGVLLLAFVAAASHLNATEEIDKTMLLSNEPLQAEPAYQPAIEAADAADAAQAVTELKKSAEISALNEAAVRHGLLWFSVSTTVGGVLLLGYCLFVRRRSRIDRTEWSQALRALGQRRELEFAPAEPEDIPVSIRLLPENRPKTNKRPVVAAPAFSHEWKRAA